MLPAMVEANNSTYLYKINLDYPVTADDMVAIGIQTPIIDTPVKNDKECNDLMKMMDEYLRVNQIRSYKFGR